MTGRKGGAVWMALGIAGLALAIGPERFALSNADAALGWLGGTVFALAVWRDLVTPVFEKIRDADFSRARLDRMKAETEEIRFRSQIHSVPAGSDTALLTPLPLQYGPPPPALHPPPTPEEGGEGESVNLLPVRDSSGRAVRYVNMPPRALRRYSEEQFREIERLIREKPELSTSEIAARVLGNKGGYQNRVVGYIRGDNEPPWTDN